MTDSFLELDGTSTVLSAVLPTKEADTICLRFYETAGRDDKIALHFGKTPVWAVSTDLMGHEVDSDVSIDGKTVSVTAKANAIGQLRITF
jgi:hypothetical protein